MKSSLRAFKCGFLEMRDLIVIGLRILPCKIEKFILTRQLSLLLLPDQCWESLGEDSRQTQCNIVDWFKDTNFQGC